MKVNEYHRENLSMLEERCSQGQSIYYNLFSKACITLEESDFDLAISLCNQYKKKDVAEECKEMKESYFADFMQEVKPPSWIMFGCRLGSKLGYRKRKKFEIITAVKKQFQPIDKELFENLESFVVDPFRDYCNAIYRRIDAQKNLEEKTKSTEHLRENIFKERDNIFDAFEKGLGSEDKSNKNEKLQEQN